jgi:hypothetical protein
LPQFTVFTRNNKQHCINKKKNKRPELFLENDVAKGSSTINWLQKWTDEIANWLQKWTDEIANSGET